MTVAPLPTQLRPVDLLRITDQTAAAVIDGAYNDLIPRSLPTTERWSTRLRSDDDLDVWLISWVPQKSTELHDHAGSMGALTVLSGSLVEHRWTGRSLRSRILAAGDQASFPLGWVHDVMQAPPAADTAEPIAVVGPTLSVHAYSPPLTAMSYYEVTHLDNAGNGRLRRTRSELTDQPEG